MLDSEPASALGLLTSLRKLLDTGLASLQNRAELLVVEFHEEKDHAVELLLWVIAVLFFASMTGLAFTATIILLFPEGKPRALVAGGLSILYLIGGLWASLGLRAR